MSHCNANMLLSPTMVRRLIDLHFITPNRTQKHFNGLLCEHSLFECKDNIRLNDLYFITPNRTQKHYNGTNNKKFLLRGDNT
jgi:hypothetical protein